VLDAEPGEDADLPGVHPDGERHLDHAMRVADDLIQRRIDLRRVGDRVELCE
jgi:hypothetical protein